MSTFQHILGLLATGMAILIWVMILLGTGFFGLGPGPGVLGVLLLAFFYGWIISAYFYYRHGRQDELLHVLAAVVEADAPLAPALWAYLDDRPRGTWRETWVFVLLFFVVPGYYWFRHRRHNFDTKVARVARRLEHGYPLADALQDVRGLLPRDAVLTVAFGESTGYLPQCLRSALHGPLANLWIEMLARVLYPVLVLLVTWSILTFWAIYIAPRMIIICQELGSGFPLTTEYVLDTITWLVAQAGWLALGLLLLLTLVILFLVSSYLRWYCPGVGRLYQMHIQARVLRILSLLIETRKPVPQALTLLLETGFGSALMRSRLRAVSTRVSQGTPLAGSLHESGLLPRSMVPLIQSAGRVGNLAWALRELAETRSGRLLRLLKQASTLLWPVMVAMLGLMVAFIALGMFLPLIDVMTRLAQ